MEVPYHVLESILDIRKHLTTVIQTLDEKSELLPHSKAMRAACRKYLDIPYNSKHGHRYLKPDNMTALGELRGVFGIHIAQISIKYGLDINNELASILPIEDINES